MLALWYKTFDFQERITDGKREMAVTYFRRINEFLSIKQHRLCGHSK